MNTIRRPTGPMAPNLQAEVQQTQQAQKTAAKPALDPSAMAAELSGEFQALNAGTLAPPSPPLAVMEQALATGAESFGQQLQGMGRSGASSEAMMLAFLKLQILDSSLGNQNQMLWGAGRSALYGTAIVAQTGAAGRAAQASSARNEAQALEAAADREAEKGHEIVREKGVDSAEIESLVEQSFKEGKSGGDVAERYAAAHKNDPDLQEKLAAIRQAEPHYQAAGAKFEQAEEKEEFASNISGGWVLGAAATLMTRAGTLGMQALLANAEAQLQLANELMALLSGIRPDAKAKDEAIQEMDRCRNEVAKLTLDFIDSHTEAKGGQMQAFRS